MKNLLIFLFLIPMGLFAQPENVSHEKLCGDWLCETGSATIKLCLHEDGSCMLDGKKASYKLDDGTLTLSNKEETVTYKVEMKEDELVLSGGDLMMPLTFHRSEEG